MNRSKMLIHFIESVTNHVADVHPDHASELTKRLNKKKIRHVKTKRATGNIKCPYVYGFSCAPEHIGGFISCCHDQTNSSDSINPVCVGNIPAPGEMAAPSVIS